VTDGDRWMPFPVAALLSASALWLAENVGTATGTWLYTGQRPGEMVSLAKLGSWYLLLFVAFVTVTLIVREPLSRTSLPLRRRLSGIASDAVDHPPR
jgi:uncharacterized membrane protein YoaT (DUF817 family)